jgi:GrpB-like predicted nucleotidyltransferase (UPF0157 family)
MSEERFQLRPPDPERLAPVRDRFIEAIRRALPHADVREVGSTAIPGSIGKQDIDILVRVPRDGFAVARQRLDALFERDAQQMANARYQGYTLSRDPDVSVQLTVTGCRHDVFLPFLEALQADPQLLQAYEQLKRDWDGKPMQAYRRAKARFIEQVLQQRSGEEDATHRPATQDGKDPAGA